MTKVTAKLVRERMDAAREAEASKLLAWETVRDTIATAAGQGLARAVFSPPPGLVLRHTVAAAEMVRRLDGKGFRADWRERRDPDGEPNHDLVVRWDVMQIID